MKKYTTPVADMFIRSADEIMGDVITSSSQPILDGVTAKDISVGWGDFGFSAGENF